MPRDEGDYEVGYGRPPKHTQFKPGQSGNPKGRPRGSKSVRTVLSEALNRKIPVRDERGRRMVTVLEAFTHRVTSEALKGEPRAIKLFFDLIRYHDALSATERTQGDAGEADVAGIALRIGEEDLEIMRKLAKSLEDVSEDPEPDLDRREGS